MIKLKTVSFLIIFAFLATFGDGFTQASKTNSTETSTTTTTKTKFTAKKYGYFELTPMAGVLFPVGVFANDFDISGRAGLDMGYRINSEVGVYGNVSYNFLSPKQSEGPGASYLSYTVGPRYYFTNPKLKSTIFLEAGVGGYSFTRDEYSITNQGITTNFPEAGETRFGVNTGIGADVIVSDNVSLMLKAKYHIIMSGGDNARSFIGTDAGVNIRF
jgi:opacity protein-like surface antigen